MWIFRNGCWDLPKGKLEPAEDFKTAALREVQEECGLDNQLKISKLLHVSFHTYIQNSKSILKRTHWYKMNYYGQNKLKPQKENYIFGCVSESRSANMLLISLKELTYG